MLYVRGIPDGGIQGGEIVLSEEKQPHDSQRVYSSTKGKHWYKVGSTLGFQKDKSRGLWVILFVLILGSVFGGIAVGFYANTHYINPPKEVFGQCPAPAYITVDDQCLIKITNKDAQGNVVVTYQNGGIVNATR